MAGIEEELLAGAAQGDLNDLGHGRTSMADGGPLSHRREPVIPDAIDPTRADAARVGYGQAAGRASGEALARTIAQGGPICINPDPTLRRAVAGPRRSVVPGGRISSPSAPCRGPASAPLRAARPPPGPWPRTGSGPG